jgi:hypothetical protein
MAHDTQRIMNTANSFILAADRCLEQRPLPSGQFQMLMVPAIVCRAFAIELYFKGIITLENGSASRDHDLSTLFSCLSSNSQLALRTNLSLDEAEFAQKLNGISGAFVEWRYIFESQSSNLDLAFLEGLAQASKRLGESMADTSLQGTLACGRT